MTEDHLLLVDCKVQSIDTFVPVPWVYLTHNPDVSSCTGPMTQEFIFSIYISYKSTLIVGFNSRQLFFEYNDYTDENVGR